MDLTINETPKPKYLIVDETNFDKVVALVKEQLGQTDEVYAQKDLQKHPTKDIYNAPMLDFVNWGSIINEITCEQVVELSSDWIVTPEIIK